ncbi:10859_t:CDS:2 [Diversispora eburnea]|uniref:10859_t:CDS:1 n=1 Tax=Diversispora eburnea TaxID=1213867 RepID=A0A9N9FCB2_9GLOM|nr:10859_t:CDS:2 [Diversispora eburnea]
MSRNKILVLGQEKNNHAGSKIHWKIITKYYTANVEFWIDETVSKDQLNYEVIKEYEKEENDPYENWCLENGFEYVDLDLDAKKNVIDSSERVGIDRILEALQSHMWEGMIRVSKENNNNNNNKKGEEEENKESNKRKEKIEPSFVMPSKQEVESMYQHIFKDFDEDDGLDKVLSRISSIRERGKSLPDEERRKLAASVAYSFSLHMEDNK